MKTKRFTISLPEEVYTILSEQAKRDHRTLGQQIAYLLEVYVPAYQRTMDRVFPAPAPATYIPHNTLGGIQTKENPAGQTETPTASSSYRQNIIG